MINKAILLGSIGTVQSNTMSNGTLVTRISIATNEQWRDKSGVKQEKTTWHNVSCFSGLAEVAAKYMKVGDIVYVEGTINNSTVKNPDGHDSHYSSIVARELKLIPKNKAVGTHSKPIANERSYNAPDSINIPF